MTHRFSSREKPDPGRLYVRTNGPIEELSYATRESPVGWEHVNCAKRRNTYPPTRGVGRVHATSTWPRDNSYSDSYGYKWGYAPVTPIEPVTYRYASDSDLRDFAAALTLADLSGDLFVDLRPDELDRLRAAVVVVRGGA